MLQHHKAATLSCECVEGERAFVVQAAALPGADGMHAADVVSPVLGRTESDPSLPGGILKQMVAFYVAFSKER